MNDEIIIPKRPRGKLSKAAEAIFKSTVRLVLPASLL